MAKIKDRIILGVIAGLGGNLIKNIIGRSCMRYGLAELNGPERAAGMLLPGYKIATFQGRLVGYIADGVIASILGLGTVYALSLTGKDKAITKGVLSGLAAWTTLYGALGTMGATKVGPVSSKTVLVELVAHTAYGATTAYLATKLGDPSLFDGRQPLSASPQTVDTLEQAATDNKPSSVM